MPIDPQGPRAEQLAEPQVLDDPLRVADRLAVEDEQRHAVLPAERLTSARSRGATARGRVVVLDARRRSSRATRPHGQSQFVGVRQR